MLSLPHTPQALVVRKFRAAAHPGGERLGTSPDRTAATFSSHMRICWTSSSPRSRPSVNRKPAARSMSSPGVRMVTRERLVLDPDLQRFLDREQVGPVLGHAVPRHLEDPPPGCAAAHVCEATPGPEHQEPGPQKPGRQTGAPKNRARREVGPGFGASQLVPLSWY